MRFAFLNSLLFFLLLTCTHVHGQSVRSHEKGGRPFGLHQYSTDELPNQQQNWSIAQDKRGIIYVANLSGVLEFDGNVWQLIPLGNSRAAFSVGVNDDGRVYVGARDDFGYLAADTTGTLTYRSLLSHVAKDDLDFGIIWTTAVTSEAVYFHANSHLFRWDGREIKSWRHDERMHTAFSVNNQFYLKRDKTGLLQMVGDSLELISGGESFAEKRVFYMGPSGDDALIGAQKGLEGPLELYRLDDNGLTALPVDQHLLNDKKDYEYTYYHGSPLPNGYMALATLYHGVFVLDENGDLVETLGADRGVGDDVNSTFADFQGGLWLAHNSSGVSYIAAPIGLASYGEQEGLSGSVNSILRHNDGLYVATDKGVYKLRDRLSDAEENEALQFDRIDMPDGSKGLYWSMLSHGNELLVSSEYGVIRISNDKAENIAFQPPESPKPGILHKSSVFDRRVYVGLGKGLGILTKRGNTWESDTLGTIDRKVTSLYEAKDGTLWLATTSPGTVWRLRLDTAGKISDQRVVASSADLGVEKISVDGFGNEVGIVALPKGVFRPIENEIGTDVDLVLDRNFLHLAELGVESGEDNKDHPVVDLVSINPAKYWTLYNDKIEETTIVNGEHVTEPLPNELMLPAWGKFMDVFVEDDGVTWISNNNFRPLLKFDPQHRTNEKITASREPIVRQLTILWADSVLYGGAFSAESAKAKFKKGKVLSVDLPHEDNDLRFDYALPHFNKQGLVEYRYILTGHDEGWSGWTDEKSVIYRNIEPGDLDFKVEARVGGIPVDGVASVSLTIRPPWFLSWWMKSFYLLFLGFTASQFVRYQRAKKQIVLLNIERELNARLQFANTQLRTANDSLEQANRMKDEFLANASHELRTPLTAILGFTSVLKEEVPQENLEFLGLIDENGKRLLQTINSLLDLAKLRAGMFDLKFEPLDIGDKTEEVVDLLAQLAKNRKLTLDVERPKDRIKVRLDAHCYERILYNLVGNAIKFTQDGGVEVKIERRDEEVRVHIVDTGVGIDASFIPQLFDEFKQEPNNEIRAEGSGLGLTITAKLVELLDGKISVKSEKGKGSTFTVAFRIDEVEFVEEDDMEAYPNEEKTQKALQ
ncbi:MAG: ATP-binding protein [Rhodothermales bacterium]